MPRLLPRLLKYLSENPLAGDKYQGSLLKKRPKQRSLWKPRPPHSPSLFLHRSSEERTRSLLLDPKDTNLLLSPGEFRPHKSLPPKVKLNARQRNATVDYDRPREMTEEERSWWANPYLRMLASPLRDCIRSKRVLPSDLLLRMKPVHLPNSRRPALVPHGIQHPRFATRPLVLAKYIACNKYVVRSQPGLQNRHPYVIEELQIGQLLRLRVAQELEMLAARMAAAPPQYSEHTILRRLTREEWEQVRTDKSIPWEGAVCVLVLPPPNYNKTFERRPVPIIDDHPPPGTESLQPTSLPPFRVVEMCSTIPSHENLRSIGPYLPVRQVPLYHGVAMFPEPSHRAAIHEKLCQILKLERDVRKRDGRMQPREKGQSKWSHAFLLVSSAKTVVRADSVPLAIALWRLKLWEENLF